MRSLLRAVIFDLDGTLGDTLPVCYAAFRAVFRRYLQREYTDEEIRATFGPSEEGVIARRIPAAARASALELYLETYAREHSVCVTPFPGVGVLLEELARCSVRLGVVTGKGPKSAAISLRALGLGARFSEVAAGSPEGAVKPGAIRRMLAAWRVAPEEAAYVGDAPNDIAAARDAGVAAVGAAWAPTADPRRLAALSPDALCATVDDCRAWLLRRL